MNILVLNLAVVAALSCEGSRCFSEWRSAPQGNQKVQIAQSIVSQKLLIGHPTAETRELLGEPDLVRDGYIYYKLKSVAEGGEFDLNGQYVLACRQQEQVIELCVIQGD